MSSPKEGERGREDGRSPTRSPSSRVRLEVEFLDADFAAAAPAPLAAMDERMHRTVLVVAAEADFRGYVRECLRERRDLRVLEAATVASAIGVAAKYSPKFLVVDEPQSDVVATLTNISAIVIVDDAPRDVPASGVRVRLLGRPFTADGLLAEVGLLLE